ncbi:ion transporter [Panacibacter ginsenosidivorans]|uniref:Ion transporter n=1 Tax=Panacibacter ginsenosidivorans TaxID=1813871 RepID=A0A5B8VCS4_9BACT|nr:ion transporter [Panacibacter ginsenosidivorans]QEC69327.1 ion transporter [Panacibacter ginsenosidivorans]
MYAQVKHTVHLLLDPADGHTIWDRIINTIIVGLILLNTLAVIFETVDSIYLPNKALFNDFEIFSVSFFSIEYISRVWSCTAKKKYTHPIAGRLKYIVSAGAIIDLLAILPFYLPLLKIYDLRFLRILRLLRFFRFFKLGRYLNASKVIGSVFKSKKEELVLSFVITMFLIIVASSVMYYAEHDAQPDKFSSIPETMWWSVATLTTVGYGDEYPITGLGKFLTACISILGIGMFALPAGILASGFSDEFRKLKAIKIPARIVAVNCSEAYVQIIIKNKCY